MAYISAGLSGVTFSVGTNATLEDPVILRGTSSDGYPTMSIHMSRADAEKLAADIQAALADLDAQQVAA